MFSTYILLLLLKNIEAFPVVKNVQLVYLIRKMHPVFPSCESTIIYNLGSAKKI